MKGKENKNKNKNQNKNPKSRMLGLEQTGGNKGKVTNERQACDTLEV